MDYGGYLGHPTTGNAAGRMVHVEDKARTQDFGYDVNGRLVRDSTTMTGPHPNTGPFVDDATTTTGSGGSQPCRCPTARS